MINGIYLDPRSWNVDCMSHPKWDTKKYGVNVFLYDIDNNKPKLDKNCKFVIATEVWTIKMQNILSSFRDTSKLKIFLLPREHAVAKSYGRLMFTNKQFANKGSYFFKPDVVLSSGQHYSNLWQDKTKTINVGHPRYDAYACNSWHDDARVIRKRYNLDENKKIIFFPSFQKIHNQAKGQEPESADISKDLGNILTVLENVAINNSDKIQVIIKIHPIVQKLYLKGRGSLDPIMQKYYGVKTGPIRVIEDIRMDSSVAKNLLYISDLVVSFRSTMLLEAAAINKPTINIMLKQAQGLGGLPDFVNRMYSVYNEKDLYNSIVDFKNYISYGPTDSNVVSDYFYSIDGNFCSRMCEAIKANI